MDLDYYAILGVSPEADIEALRDSYRMRAFEYHPDCGGSHEQMTLINEAWAILSNPTTRRNYDSARKDQSDFEAQRAAREDVKKARPKAQEYPRKWTDFEVWLDRLLRDFTEVKYGTIRGPLIFFPTAGRSFSGWLLVIAGGIFGFFVGFYINLLIGSRLHPLAVALLSTSGGAWLGMLIHDRIGKSLGKKERADSEPKGDERTRKEHTKAKPQSESKEKFSGHSLSKKRVIQSAWAIFFIGAIIFYALLFIGDIKSKHDSGYYEEKRFEKEYKKEYQGEYTPIYPKMDSQEYWNFLLAGGSYEKKEYNKALDYLNKATNMCPSYPSPWSLRAEIYYKIGNVELMCNNAEWACKLGSCKILMEFQQKGYCRK